MQFWFGDPDFGTFWFIYKDPVNIFQNQFLRWNHKLKSEYHEPYKQNNFFFQVIKGVANF